MGRQFSDLSLALAAVYAAFTERDTMGKHDREDVDDDQRNGNEYNPEPTEVVVEEESSEPIKVEVFFEEHGTSLKIKLRTAARVEISG